MTTYTNQVQAGQNLSTIAQNAGLTPQQFAALNPQLANSSNNYQGLNNVVQVGAGYNLTAPTNTLPQGNTGAPTGSATVTGTNTLATPSGSYQSPETLAAQQAQANYLNSLTNPDENSIYQQKLAQMQASIDATNNMYADELARAKQTGTGRLGTSTAINARRGTLGSDFGVAQYNTVEDANKQIENSIENERLARINAIMSQAKSDASSEYRSKRDEFAKGLDARLAYYQNADQRKVDNTSKAVKAILAQGLDINSIDPTSLTSYAKYYGITPEDIKASYATEKKAYDEAQVKANPSFELSQGQSKYTYNPSTGKYEVVASVAPKATASKSGTGVKKTVAAQQGSDVADVISLFKNKMSQNKWVGGNPDDYNYYRNTLLKTYGSAATKLLDSEMANAGLNVDYINK